MTNKCCIQTNPDLGILLLRFALALVFIIHGLAKFQAMPGTITFFSTLGLLPIMAYFVAIVELFGGILLLLGMLTPWTALILGINMAFAIFLVKLEKPFLGGYEYDLTLMLVSFGLSLLGTGKYTVCPCGKERKR
ncbi:MAG: DoxX family protein [bacterium]|nr:DoxX family protein [bacterium]